MYKVYLGGGDQAMDWIRSIEVDSTVGDDR
jgi:hypothetical protein